MHCWFSALRSMPYLETTSSSAVQDYVYKGDRSKGGFCVQQTAASKTRSYDVPTPFRETSLYESIQTKYRDAAHHNSGKFQSQHSSLHSYGAPNAPLRPNSFHHDAHLDYMPEERYAYSSRSASTDVYSSQSRGAATSVDHGGYASHRSAIKYGLLPERASSNGLDEDQVVNDWQQQPSASQPSRRKYFPGHRTGPTQYGRPFNADMQPSY